MKIFFLERKNPFYGIFLNFVKFVIRPISLRMFCFRYCMFWGLFAYTFVKRQEKWLYYLKIFYTNRDESFFGDCQIKRKLMRINLSYNKMQYILYAFGTNKYLGRPQTKQQILDDLL